MMEIPPGVKVHEFRNSVIWISDEGIVYSKSKGRSSEDIEPHEVREEMDKLRALLGNKKACLVLESSPNSKPPRKEHRDFIANELNSISKAMAIVTESPMSRMIANLFFAFKKPAYPVKMFSNEPDATAWIRQYL